VTVKKDSLDSGEAECDRFVFQLYHLCPADGLEDQIAWFAMFTKHPCRSILSDRRPEANPSLRQVRVRFQPPIKEIEWIIKKLKINLDNIACYDNILVKY
jgi:hypothetical protein